MSRKSISILPFLLLAIALAGCGERAPEQPTQIPDLLYTVAANTIIAELTLQASPETPTPPPPPATDTPPPATDTPAPVDTPTPEASPTATPELAETNTPTPAAQVLFQDDFSRETGWWTNETDNYTVEYAAGGYRFSITSLNTAIWSIREQSYAGVRLEVDATQTGGVSDGYYGLVCRYDDDNNYYALVISSNGSFGIAKSEAGELEFLQQGSDSALIQPGNATNRVRADCAGQTLSLYANDRLLLEIEDDDFEAGFIGLLAGTRLTGGVEVLFDNYAILRP